MNERNVLMNASILRRVIELPYDDPRRKALLEILYNEFATNLLTGLPVQGVLFKPAKWKEHVSVYMGLPPPETRKSVNQHIIIKGVIRGKVDLHANNLLNSHYAPGGGTSPNHNTILGNVEVGLHDAGVPFKSTGSTNGQGTKNIFRRKLPENPSGSSLEKTNKIIPDLVIRASHLSGGNGADFDLDGANHIVDFMALQGFSHDDNTSTIPGATLEKRQKAVNKEYHDRTRKLDSELHGSQKDRRGPIESELNEYGHGFVVFLPQSLADTGVLPLISASFWTSSLGKWLANTRHSTALAFRKPKPCSDRSLHANGVTMLLGDGRLFFWIA